MSVHDFSRRQAEILAKSVEYEMSVMLPISGQAVCDAARKRIGDFCKEYGVEFGGDKLTTEEKNQQIHDIDLKIERIKRQLTTLNTNNNEFERDLAPYKERLRLGRMQEIELQNELIRLGNDKLNLGWKWHEANF